MISDAERKHIVELLEENGMDVPSLVGYLKDTYGIKAVGEIKSSDYAAVCLWIKEGPEIPFGK